MDNGRSELRWGVEQRLEFIEFRLFWEGHVNRSDLMDQFGVSVNQASTDLNRYIGFAPDNMVYDTSARTYVRGPAFKPRFLEPDASSYLAQLRSVADGILDREDAAKKLLEEAGVEGIGRAGKQDRRRRHVVQQAAGAGDAGGDRRDPQSYVIFDAGRR